MFIENGIRQTASLSVLCLSETLAKITSSKKGDGGSGAAFAHHSISEEPTILNES